MPSLNPRRVVLPLATLLALLVASPALADRDGPVELGITPLGQEGSWFELELEPGEQVDLDIELANHGDQAVEARSYAADVYSLINGGMGVALQGEVAESPVPGWIDYPSSTPMLAPDAALRHTLTVAVPADALPGRYIAALVIEHEVDRADDAEGLGIDQVVRQAIAVDITVPGPVDARLELGGTGHLLTADLSTLRTELDNPGNWHLVPAGRLELVAPDGRTVVEQDLELAIVYAGTSTHVETVLDHELEPGTYTITTTLADPGHEVATTHTSTFEVEAPPRDAAVPGLDRVIETLDEAGLSPLRAALLASGLLLAGALVALVRRRRRRPAAELPLPPPPVLAPRPSTPPPPPAAPPAPTPVAAPRPTEPPPREPVPALPGIDTSFFTAHGRPAARNRR